MEKFAVADSNSDSNSDSNDSDKSIYDITSDDVVITNYGMPGENSGGDCNW